MSEELKSKIVWQENKDFGKVCTLTESVLNGIINEATKELQEQIEKMKCCINDLVHLGEFNENTDEEYLNYQVHEALKNAEQFIKE